MAMQQRKRRRRSGGNNNNNNNPNKHFESNGPEVRIRGSAAQILEKYQQYARDAQTSGDRVKAEALYQHAEHYARVVAEINKEQEKARAEREAREAAKAEERAARDAERNAEREARGEAAAERNASEAETQSSADDAAPEAKTERAPQRRNRKPRETSAVETPAEAGTDSAETIGMESEAAIEKPKRTRKRSTKPSEDAAEENGVMKTLARGAEADAD